MKTELDLAIIGGGIIGVLAATYARRQYPNWKIAIFDQHKLGSGATHYSASLDLPYGHTALRYRLSKRSATLYGQLRKEFPQLPIKDLSLYGIVSSHNAAAVLQQITDSYAVISPDSITLLSQNYPGLILPPNSTVITGGTASQAMQNEVAVLLAKSFIATPGSLLYEHTPVTTVQAFGNGFKIDALHEGSFNAAKIIQATGPWMNYLLGSGLAPAKKIRIKKIVAFHIYEPPNQSDSVFYFFDDDAFLMPKYEAGYWLFSFKCDHWDVQPDIATLKIDDADVQKAQCILTKYYPSFASRCTTGRVFCDGYTDDGNPVIEPANGNNNYIIAGAAAGSGYRLAPAMAEDAVRRLLPRAALV